jgi:hypothetical protein
MIPKILKMFFSITSSMSSSSSYMRERERERENAMGTPHGMRRMRGTPYDMNWEIHNSPQNHKCQNNCMHVCMFALAFYHVCAPQYTKFVVCVTPRLELVHFC